MKNQNTPHDSGSELNQGFVEMNTPSEELIEPLDSRNQTEKNTSRSVESPAASDVSEKTLYRKENPVLRTLIAALFLIVFAYNIWQGIDSTIVISQAVPLDPIQWTILLSSIVLPFLLWAFTCWLMWPQSRPKMALALFVAWAVSSMAFLDLNALISVTFL